MAVSGLRNLCTPSYVYLVISAIALVVMMYQNMGNVDKYCLGSYSCNVSSTALIFVIKAVYILFWTWVLNMICRAGHSGIAWFVLLLPVILLFVVLGSMIFYNTTKEGLETGDKAAYAKEKSKLEDQEKKIMEAAKILAVANSTTRTDQLSFGDQLASLDQRVAALEGVKPPPRQK